jgi:bifunctional non-homologous end joining protein LigD
VASAKKTEIEVDGKRLTLTNLDKLLYPEAGFTKGQLIDYYVRIAPVLLQHLKDRPLTLKRYPNGVTGFHFYEKNCPEHRPEFVKTAKIWSEGNNRWMDYCTVHDMATLVWLGNLADIELHTSLSRAQKMQQPTMLVFDLDPGAPANIVECCHVGVWVREIFAALGLKTFAKTSGSKGLQIYCPLNSPVTYDDTKPFARRVAQLLEDQRRDFVVSDMKKALRVGKIFVDWSQNDDYKTTVCVYSMRAKEKPTVSTPVEWKEVENCRKKRDASLLVFEYDEVLRRVEQHGDLFAPVLKLKQKLPSIEKLEAAVEKVASTGLFKAAKPPARDSRDPQRMPPRELSQKRGHG